MKRLQQIILILVLLVCSAASASAATINISGHTVNPPTTYPGSTCTLRIYSSISFSAADGTTVMAGTPGSGAFFKSVACTISSGTIALASFSLPSTTDALDNQNARYTAIFFDSKGVKRDVLLADFQLPTSLGSSVTWAQIKVYKVGQEPWRDTGTYTKSQTDAQIALALGTLNDASDVVKGRTYLNVAPQSAISPVAIGSNWGRVNAIPLDVSEYGDNLNNAVTAIGSVTNVTLAVSRPTLVTGNVTVTPNIELKFKNGGYVDLTTGTTTTIQGAVIAEPNRVFFNATAGQGTVSFTGNKSTNVLYPQWWGATGDGATDDTAAIQAAITAAGTLKVATIKIPNGVYKIDGSLQGETGFQAKLLLPAVNPQGNEGVHITIEGESAPPDGFNTAPSTYLVTTKAAIFKTTGTAGSVFGGTSSSGANFSAAQLTLRNVVIRVPANPAINGVNGSYMGGLFIQKSILDSGSITTNTTQPTNTSVGIITPLLANNANIQLRDVIIQGFKVGIQVNEHTIGDNIVISACANAMEFLAGHHASQFNRVGLYNNTRNIIITGSFAYTSIAQLNLEHADSSLTGTPAWQDTVFDFDDVGNGLNGFIYWHTTQAGLSGGIDTLLVNGASRVALLPLDRAGQAAATLATNSAAQSIPNATNTALTFDNETYDSLKSHSTSVNTSRFTVVRTNVYDIVVKVDFAANAAGTRALNLRLNGTTIIPGVSMNAVAEAALASRLSASFQIPLDAGDYVEALVFQSSTGALNTVVITGYSPSVAIKATVPY